MVDRRADYAIALAAEGEHAAALELMKDAMQMAPNWAAGWYQLGQIAGDANDKSTARHAYSKVMSLDPKDRFGASLQIDLLRERPIAERMPSAFVKTLFDQSAKTFDASLVKSLEYQRPEMILRALLHAGRSQFENTVDLGCGTGLMGAIIRPHTHWLAGYDISAPMLDQARAKGIYDHLAQLDMSELSVEPQRFDLITAADVFIYIGALEHTVSWAAASLAPGGTFTFTVEEHFGPEDFILRPSRRFAHSARYVTRILEQAGFMVETPHRATLRNDRNAPVAGLVICACTASQSQPRHQSDGEDLATV